MTSRETRKDKRAAVLPAREGIQKAVTGFLKKALERGCFEAVMMPVRAPETRSYAWLMVKNPELLDEAAPLPPVMSVQGGRALSSLTKHGAPPLSIGVVLRPCEARAAVELVKLKQIQLDDVHVITIDCPGALPLKDYVRGGENALDRFQALLEHWDEDGAIRPACERCHRFSLDISDEDRPLAPSSKNGAFPVEIHIGLLGENKEEILLIPLNPSGEETLEKLGLTPDRPLDGWAARVRALRKKKEEKRRAGHEEFKKEISGLDRFLAVFDACINCHNCQNVCPVCYCQQCHFDSPRQHLTAQRYLDRARRRGALRLPLDPLLFHLGRMSHMVLSCVSCGACEDACPVSIPVGKVFSLVADETQPHFQYTAGKSADEPLPLQSFLKSEFCEVETPSECREHQSPEVKSHA